MILHGLYCRSLAVFALASTLVPSQCLWTSLSLWSRHHVSLCPCQHFGPCRHFGSWTATQFSPLLALQSLFSTSGLHCHSGLATMSVYVPANISVPADILVLGQPLGLSPLHLSPAAGLQSLKLSCMELHLMLQLESELCSMPVILEWAWQSTLNLSSCKPKDHTSE